MAEPGQEVAAAPEPGVPSGISGGLAGSFPPASTARQRADELRVVSMVEPAARRERALADRGAGRPAVSVLADRIAASLVHHEPGWRLPRHSALARRYNVSPAEIDAAISELASRHLIRRLADGQLYRASPAEYLISLEGVPGLASSVDAMGAEFACRSRQVSFRQVPEDIGWALGLRAGEPVCVVRFLWTVGGEPAAFCTTYLPKELAGQPAEVASALPARLSLLPLTLAELGRDTGVAAELSGRPAALHVEMQAPPPSVARSLRLVPGEPATMITVRFDDPEQGGPVALTIAVLRADMFRVVVQSPPPPLAAGDGGSLTAAWTHAVEDWEP
jgi:DNA-binding GntR family transcriptional regulator